MLSVLKRLGLIAAAILIPLILVLRFGNLPEPLPEGTQSAELVQNGPFKVVKIETTLVDESRPTQANGDYAGDDHRSFKTSIWYPEKGESLPLVIYSHGFSSSRKGGDYLGNYLASQGYVVAAMDYPLTNFSAPGGPMAEDVANQPEDVSFLIDTLLTRNDRAGDELANRIDPSRIAAAGLSMGGMTTTMAAFHPRLKDERISVAVSIAGPTMMFGPSFYSRSLPFLMIASPQDALINYDQNALPVLSQIPNSILLTMDGASHTGFGGPARYLRWMRNPDKLGCNQVMKHLKDVDNDQWAAIGSEAEGIVAGEMPAMCQTDPLPKALNPIYQTDLTKLAVFAYLQSWFAEDAEEREWFYQFLTKVLPTEIDEIEIANAFTLSGKLP